MAALLLGAIDAGRFIELAYPLSRSLWGQVVGGEPVVWPSDLPSPASGAALQAHRQAAQRLRQRLGHYLGATFFYGGEWYWGLDRLHHLERRLQDLGTARDDQTELMLAPDEDRFDAPPRDDAPAIDFYFSLRSPYSAIVAPRVFALGRASGAAVRLRYVLPMVMRGLAVPAIKRRYIATDAAREAFVRGIAFGRINDPLGRPTERGLALMPLAERAGLGQDYVLSFMRGVWAEGLDAGRDAGLRRIAERAGLDWADAHRALDDAVWRERAEAHRTQLSALGLWGVPSFCVGNTAVWGQDRLWAVRQALQVRHTNDTAPDL
jgi:2-hydroxychromene-2-carboxylate isomerase